MRLARKLTLLAMLASAAFAAPPAFAQTSTEPEAHNQTPRLIVQQEVHAGFADVNCPLVTPSPPVSPPALPPTTAGGGCRTHMASVGTFVLSGHDAVGNENVVTNCNAEFDLRIDVAGEGYFTHQEFTGGAACFWKACGQTTPPTSEGRIWSFWMQENEVAGDPVRERATYLLCIEPFTGGAASHCELTVPFSQPVTHRYQFALSDTACHEASTARSEFSGTFDVEATPGTSGEALAESNIEIRHN